MGGIKNLVFLISFWVDDLLNPQPCVLRGGYESEDGEKVGACMCDPVGECSLIYEGKCWINGRKRPFITPFKFKTMVAKGKVFNCATHEWEDNNGQK